MAEPLPTLATLVTVKLALVTTGVTTVAVLLPAVRSGVVDVPATVLVTLPVAAVTVALTAIVMVCPTARLAWVTVNPTALLLASAPPVTTGVP